MTVIYWYWDIQNIYFLNFYMMPIRNIKYFDVLYYKSVKLFWEKQRKPKEEESKIFSQETTMNMAIYLSCFGVCLVRGNSPI